LVVKWPGIAIAIMSEKKIVDSWKKNVSPWMKAIQYKEIESRRLVTDQTIVDTISAIPAKRIIDIGCGEGWLVRELSALGMCVTGIDAVEELVGKARELGGGSFEVLEYEKLTTDTIGEKYDVAVCNFSLLGNESVEHLFNTIPSILNDGGFIVIQTLHPRFSCGDLPYIDGWREGSWVGFSNEFCDPAPWYFRTTESWFKLFHSYGFTLNDVKEPINPKTGKVTSLILVGSVAV
jgi:2-polyprenyl-3-methyl-5-hydroxy-6-metoxy-1,4-benzoquinol methylase